MNDTIRRATEAALSDPQFSTMPGESEWFVEQIVKRLYGTRYDHVFRSTARDTAEGWRKSGFSLRQDTPVDPGDIVFKLNDVDPDGRVGIYLGSGDVAESSGRLAGRKQGARGTTTLEHWGKPDLVVRLPDLPIPYRVFHGSLYLGDAIYEDGVALFPIRSWCETFGVSISWDPHDKKLSVRGKAVKDRPEIIGGHAYLQLQTLAQSSSLTLAGPDSSLAFYVS